MTTKSRYPTSRPCRPFLGKRTIRNGTPAKVAIINGFLKIDNWMINLSAIDQIYLGYNVNSEELTNQNATVTICFGRQQEILMPVQPCHVQHWFDEDTGTAGTHVEFSEPLASEIRACFGFPES